MTKNIQANRTWSSDGDKEGALQTQDDDDVVWDPGFQTMQRQPTKLE